MIYTFNKPVSQLGALSLVAGLAAAEAVETCCDVKVGLKWPNDLQIGGRKLAGCLIDIEGKPDAPSAIIGIGINVDFRRQSAPDQPWTDLASEVIAPPDRHWLAALLIHRLSVELPDFDQFGFAALRDRWMQRDVLFGRDITAFSDGQTPLKGRAAGLDAHGHLQLEQNGVVHALKTGLVTLKEPA